MISKYERIQRINFYPFLLAMCYDSLSEVRIYKRKQESKKKRTRPRKRSRKQENDEEKKKKTFFFS